MGQFIMKALNSLSTRKQRKILMLGLDAVGKTTILHRMNLHEHIKTIPTIGFNVENIQYKNLKLTIWDVCGQSKLRLLWSHYYENTDALIYVLDSSDAERMHEAKQALEIVLENSQMTGIPILLFANKLDIAVMDILEIIKEMKLQNLKGIGEWHIQGCDALTGEGILQGLDWLSNILNK